MIEDLFLYLDEIYSNEKVKLNYGQVCYFKDYVKLAKEIPKDKIVVDVGCSFGLQHLLFQKHKRYIGIQKFREGINCEKDFKPNFEVFTENAEIIEKEFEDVETIELGWNVENKNQFFGIANHSLWNDIEKNKKAIELFKRLFPQNYYATAEDSSIIKY